MPVLTDVSRDEWVMLKTRLILKGRAYLTTSAHDLATEALRIAALIEEHLAETADTDPNGPRREDHLASAASLRALAVPR